MHRISHGTRSCDITTRNSDGCAYDSAGMELNRSTFTTLLELIGAVSLVIGVGLLSIPIALMTAGVLLIAAGVLSA